MEVVKFQKFPPYLLLGLGFVIALLRVKITQDEDMGAFLGYSSLIAHGYHLYSDITELKDPLFYFGSALAIKVFGNVGPYFMDFVWIMIAPYVAFKFLFELTKSHLASLLGSLMFVLSLTGVVYQSFRSQIAGIVLILLCLYEVMRKRLFTSGGIFAIVILYKFPFLVFGLSAAYILLLENRKWVAIRSFILGVSTVVMIVFGIMFLRGELIGYFGNVLTNFRYSANYQAIAGLPQGLLGHFQIWETFRNSLTCFIIITSIAILSQITLLNNKIELKRTRNLLLSISVSTIVFLGKSLLWPHHLQVLSLFACISTAYGVLFIESWFESNALSRLKESRGKKRNTITWHQKSNLLVGAFTILLLVPSATGADFNLRPRMNLNEWITPSWVVPPEAKLLNSLDPSQSKAEKIRIGRLGMNDTFGYLAFINKDRFDFRCKVIGISGFETLTFVKEHMNCIGTEVDYITISPMYENQPRYAGFYSDYLQEMNKILKSKFDCFLEEGGYRLCKRKI